MANLTVWQLTNHFLQLKIDVVHNRNITDRCIGRKGLHLNISGTIQFAKNFLNFKKVLKCERMFRHQPAQHLTVFLDVASECSKTTSILSDGDISHSLSRNVSGSVFITCQSVEVLKINLNLNRVIISKINVNSIRNKIELLSEAVFGNIDSL